MNDILSTSRNLQKVGNVIFWTFSMLKFYIEVILRLGANCRFPAPSGWSVTNACKKLIHNALIVHCIAPYLTFFHPLFKFAEDYCKEPLCSHFGWLECKHVFISGKWSIFMTGSVLPWRTISSLQRNLIMANQLIQIFKKK